MIDEDMLKELAIMIEKNEVIIVLDDKGKVHGGFGKVYRDGNQKWSRLRPLRETNQLPNPADPDEPFNGKRILEDHHQISLIKVSASPGHWVIVGGKRIWVP